MDEYNEKIQEAFYAVAEKLNLDDTALRGRVPVPFEVWKELGYTDEDARILAWASIVCKHRYRFER